MHEGRLQQLAPPAELYSRPANLFVARFCGSPPMNVVAGEIAEGVFTHACGSIRVSGAARGPVKLGFRPERAGMVERGAPDSLDAEVYVVEPLGNETLVTVSLGGELVNLRAAAGVDPAIGTHIGLAPDRAHLHLFDPDTGAAVTGAPAPKEDRTPATARPQTPPVPPPTEGALHDRQHES
jgi:ABC-type sugar transport system ATPase subunit